MQARTANVMTRVEPIIKEQAETVLGQLGISMSTAVSVYLRQIAMHRKIPFEMALPAKPRVFSSYSDEELDAMMNEALQSYEDGKCIGVEEFEAELQKEFGI